MDRLNLISYFFGGAFLCNAIPYVVSGLMGRPFQSPFAKPPGQGLFSSTVNVLWGVLNLAITYALICRVGDFSLLSTDHAATLGLGFLLIGLYSARDFGRWQPVSFVNQTYCRSREQLPKTQAFIARCAKLCSERGQRFRAGTKAFLAPRRPRRHRMQSGQMLTGHLGLPK